MDDQITHFGMDWSQLYDNDDAQIDAELLKSLDQYEITHIEIPEEGQLTSTSNIGKVPTK